MTEASFRITVNIDPEPSAVPEWDGQRVAGLVVKAEDERRFTLTVAYPVNKTDVAVARDGYQDFAKAAAIEDAAWEYLRNSPVVGLDHEDGTDGAGHVVESYIYRGPDWVVKAADGSEQVIKAGDWLVGIQWDEQSWDDFKSGKRTGVSMQGMAERVEADPADLIGLRS